MRAGQLLDHRGSAGHESTPPKWRNAAPPFAVFGAGVQRDVKNGDVNSERASRLHLPISIHLYALPACGYGKAARSASSAHISSWRSCSSREASVSRSVVSRVRSARRRVLGLKWLHAANERIWHSAVASLAAPHSAPGPLAPEVTPEGPVAWLGLGAWLGVWLES